MERTGPGQLPAAVEAVRKRIARWRRNRNQDWARMPEPLWKAAAHVGGVHGINPVAKALGLDYYNLKRRVQREGKTAKAPATPPLFMQLDLPGRAGSGGFVLELEAPDGARMTVRLPDAGQLDLVALAESFWGRRR